jgi:hypothetical protein
MWGLVELDTEMDSESDYIYVSSNTSKVKVKLSRYMPWKHMEGEEV